MQALQPPLKGASLPSSIKGLFRSSVSPMDPITFDDFAQNPVWVFGRSFSVKYDLDELRRTISNCLWITYRKNFPPIDNTSLTSDRGWGCMIRTGQMVLAKALTLRFLGLNWSWHTESKHPSYLHLISLFADTPEASFSLHRLAESGAALGKPVGSWLGPNTVCQAIKKLINEQSQSQFYGNPTVAVDVEVFIAMDSILMKSSVKQKCLSSSSTMQCSSSSSTRMSTSPPVVPLAASSSPSTGSHAPRPDPKWKPLLLVIPLRLGLTTINEEYIPALKSVLETPGNIGVIGGRPNHALYFVGYAGEEILYLDPHTVQQASAVGAKITEEEVAADGTYHSEKTGRMWFGDMDPSIAVCFYCAQESELDTLCSTLLDKFSKTPLALFEINEKEHNEDNYAAAASALEGSLAAACGGATYRSFRSDVLAGGFEDLLDDDDFELL